MTDTHTEHTPEVVEAVARAIAKVDGLDFDEVCGFMTDAEECNSSTCVAANYEDHDSEWAREVYFRQARAAIAAMNPKHAEPAIRVVDCVGCEGNPSRENNPCAGCGHTRTAAEVGEPDVGRAAAIIRNWRAGNAGEDDAKDTARLVLSLYTRPTPSDQSKLVAELVEAAQAVLDGAQSTFRARNGRQVGIEADDGEKCLIVHSDLMMHLEHAITRARQIAEKAGG